MITSHLLHRFTYVKLLLVLVATHSLQPSLAAPQKNLNPQSKKSEKIINNIIQMATDHKILNANLSNKLALDLIKLASETQQPHSQSKFSISPSAIDYAIKEISLISPTLAEMKTTNTPENWARNFMRATFAADQIVGSKRYNYSRDNLFGHYFDSFKTGRIIDSLTWSEIATWVSNHKDISVKEAFDKATIDLIIAQPAYGYDVVMGFKTRRYWPSPSFFIAIGVINSSPSIQESLKISPQFKKWSTSISTINKTVLSRGQELISNRTIKVHDLENDLFALNAYTNMINFTLKEDSPYRQTIAAMSANLRDQLETRIYRGAVKLGECTKSLNSK